MGASNRPTSSARCDERDRFAGGTERGGNGERERREGSRGERSTGLELRESALPIRRHQLGAREFVEGHREHLGLKRDEEVVVSVRDVSERLMEDLDGSAELAAGRHCAPELEGNPRSRPWIVGERDRLAEVPLEVLPPSVGRLGEAELVQDGAALILRRRLVKRALEITDGGLRSAACSGVAGGRSQQRHARRIAVRCESQHVPTYALVFRLARLHQCGSPPVEALTLERRDLPVYGAPHHRMNEVELDIAVGDQHPRGDERLGSAADRFLIEFGQRRDVAQRCRRA